MWRYDNVTMRREAFLQIEKEKKNVMYAGTISKEKKYINFHEHHHNLIRFQ